MCDVHNWLITNGFKRNATINSKIGIKYGIEPKTYIVEFNPLSKLCRDDNIELGELFFENKMPPQRSYANYDLFVKLHKHLGKPKIDESIYKWIK